MTLKNMISLFVRKKKKPLVYIHVPKCGGSSIRNAIIKSRNNNFKTEKKEYFRIRSKETKDYADTNKINILDYRESIFIDKMNSKKYDFITGHTRCIPVIKNQYSDRYQFITLLRDPVERWFSNYFYNFYKKDDHCKTDLTLKEYLEAEKSNKINFNIYTTYFADPSITDTEAKVESACKNLATFDVVGTLEDLDRFRDSYKVKFSSSLKIPHSNVNKFIDKVDRENTISDEIRREVEILCENDKKVYEYAKRVLA